MMQNPFTVLLQMSQRGQNIMPVLQQATKMNPQMAQAMRMIQGKNAEQLKQTAENMAKERGIDLEQVAQQMGIQLPK